MKRKLKICLEIEVEDLSDQDRQVNAKLITGEDASTMEIAEALADMPLVKDLLPGEVAAVAEGWLENADDEMWAGTEIFATFSDVVVVSSEWVDDL